MALLHERAESAIAGIRPDRGASALGKNPSRKVTGRTPSVKTSTAREYDFPGPSTNRSGTFCKASMPGATADESAFQDHPYWVHATMSCGFVPELVTTVLTNCTLPPEGRFVAREESCAAITTLRSASSG